ncbi:MAG TPA: benzoate-CoA ligase family protein [Gemmatimonadaceae bacterium]|nr:benzoate-CoA ligase family protein [Gemmatimonadaceae bacterium]
MEHSAREASRIEVPRTFNAAAYFVDRHVLEGREHRVALVCEGRERSYSDVACGANQIGNALRALGVRMEERVVLVLPDVPEFVFAFWGAMKIGAVPVPANTRLTTRDYVYILNDTRAAMAIVSQAHAASIESVRASLPFLRHVIVVGRADARQLAFDALVESASTELDPAPTTCDDAAFWLYSSGTTGTPKGVIHLHHDMVACCDGFGRHILEITEDDRTYSIAKLFFAYGLGNALYFPFWVGASTVLDAAHPEPAHVFDMIDRTQPTLFYAVPTAFAAMLREASQTGRRELGAVRRCLSAGEPLPKALYERWLSRFGVEILDGIGSTEMCHTFIANRAGAVRPGSSGTLVPGYDAKIVDDDGRTLPDGEVGNLLVSGDSCCAGYWNQHERTKAVITGGWMRTGDKYARDADGYFWYAGRSDDMIKAGGIWVSPTEVESTLIEHDAVLEAGVVGAADVDELVKPFAFIVLADGQAASPTLEQELRAFVKERLAPFKCPRWVVFTDALPKTATGKIQRYRLREMAAITPHDVPSATL